MTDPPDRLAIDPTIHAWLDDHAPPYAPRDILDGALARTARLDRRPAWRIPERWIPMRISMALAVIPRAALAAAILLLLAIAAGAVVVASQPSTPPLPPPMGAARNGLLAYDSHGDIWTMQPDGTDKHRLTSGPERDVSPIWSRDGTMIAFWSWPADPAVADGYSMPRFESGDASLVVVDADGSHRRVVAESIPLSMGNLEFSWSPDGRQIAFASDAGDGDWIEIASVEGSPSRTLVEGDTPRWSPDGSWIAYRASAGPSVMIVPPEGGEPRRLTQARGSGGAFSAPSWSPDGSALTYYASDDGIHDIWVVNADGTRERQLTADLDDEYWPAWSPAGDRISFSRVVGGTDNRPTMVVVGVDGTGERTLSDEPMAVGMNSSWSPDGTSLVAGREGDAGSFVLKMLDVTGGSPVLDLPLADTLGYVGWQRLAP